MRLSRRTRAVKKLLRSCSETSYTVLSGNNNNVVSYFSDSGGLSLLADSCWERFGPQKHADRPTWPRFSLNYFSCRFLLRAIHDREVRRYEPHTSSRWMSPIITLYSLKRWR